MTGETAARMALYWAPPADSALWRFGSAWLGRNAETGADRPPPALETGMDAGWQQDATAEPRRYGLHATLKPPFRLASGATRDELVTALGEHAAARKPIVAPPPVLRRLGRFL